jgi:hypothetical protein
MYAESARPRSTESDIDPVMPGFITWLSNHEPPSGRRRRHHLAAERFLCWHTGHRHSRELAGQNLIDHDFEPCVPDYLATLRGAGHGHVELGIVETAINHLRRYLNSGPDHRTPPGRRS